MTEAGPTFRTHAKEHFDAIVIGSGQGGGPLAGALARAGWKTALIERADVGGTCINTGCTPTKTMVASARAAHMAQRAADYGVKLEWHGVDMDRVRQRKRQIVKSFRGGSESRLNGIDHLELIYGEAAFAEGVSGAGRPIEVQQRGGGLRTLTSEHIFIDTGTRTAVPGIAGLQTVPYLDNTSIMELDTLPEHLVVLGGGYIGLEFGQMFRRFGAKVTIIQSGPQLLGREDEDVAAEVLKIVREDGITVLLEAKATGVSVVDGGVAVQVEVGSITQTIKGSHLLVAVGRTANTEALKLENAGVEVDSKGFIKVNDRLETNVPGVYAIGDVKGGPAFTHISYDDYRVLKANLLQARTDAKPATIRGRMVPYTVYIDPQLGRIGMTETEARNYSKETGRKIEVAKMPMTYVARALEVDETRGFMKAIVDAESGQILGAAILGIEGGEMAAMIEIAMMGKLPYTALQDAVFAHPTLAESLNNLWGYFQKE